MTDFKKYLEKLIDKNKLISINPGDKHQIHELQIIIGIVPKSYDIFLHSVGYGIINGYEFNGTGKNVCAVVYDTELEKKLYEQIPDKKPNFNYLVITNIGDDVTWYMDLDARDPKTGECPIVGWIAGLSADEQPEWVKKEEYYPTFEHFFRSKVGNTDNL